MFMGGTFDPIHNGHLRTALEIRHWLGVDRVGLIPAKTPVHRGDPGCSSEQRLRMVELAVKDEAALFADDREIRSAEASYSLLTLLGLRAELGPERPVMMVMGMDAFLSLPGWHGWQQLTDYAHLLVVQRPGYQQPLCPVLARFAEQHKVDSPEQLPGAAGGLLFHELTPLAISATQVRESILRGESPRYLLPDAVWHYIQENRLYGLKT